MAGLRDAEVDVLLKTTSDGLAEYAKNMAAMVALREESRRLGESQNEISTSTGGVRREMEKLEPNLRSHRGALQDMVKDYRDSRLVVNALGSTIGVTGREFEKLASSIGEATVASGGGGGFMSTIKSALGPLDSFDTTMATIGRTAIPTLVGALIALTVVLSPVVLMMASWLIVATAFTAGLAALIAVAGIAGLAFGGLGAAVIALGLAQSGGTTSAKDLTAAHKAVVTATQAHDAAVQSLQRAENSAAASRSPSANQMLAISTAQQRVTETANTLTTAQNNLTAAQTNSQAPAQQFIQSIQQMGTALGQQAVPLMNQMIVAADQFLPRIQQLGSQLLSWFGERLPTVLGIAVRVLNDLLGEGGLAKLGTVLSRVMDYVIAHTDQFESIFSFFLTLGVQAIAGLLGNLIRLSDWFINNWPTMYTVTSQGFNAIGFAIQGIGTSAATVVNWITENWPHIVAAATPVLEVFGMLSELLGHLYAGLILLGPVIDFLTAHSLEFKIVIGALLAIFFVALGTIALLIAVLVLLTAAIVAVISFVRFLIQHFALAVLSVVGMFDPLAGLVGRFVLLGVATVNLANTIGTNWQRIRNTVVGWAENTKDTLSGVWNAVVAITGGVGQRVWQAIRFGLNQAVGSIDNFIRAGRGFLHTFGVNALDNVWMNTFAEGGVVNKPTMALVGEAGPEVVVPVGHGKGGRGAQLWAQAGEMLGLMNPGMGGAMGGLSHGLGAGADTTPGHHGGQCVVFVENVTGHYFPVAMASQMTRFINSHSAQAGEIFVSTLSPFGHAGFVIGGGKVLDSNWAGDERIRIHNLSDVPNIAGYIRGIPVSGLPGGIFDVMGALKGLISGALGGLGGWQGGVARGLLDKAMTGHLSFDSGGIWPTGTVGVNTSGSDEHVSSSAQMESQLKLLASIDRHLADISGKPKLSPLAAQQRTG